jgi:hypothetical protein
MKRTLILWETKTSSFFRFLTIRSEVSWQWQWKNVPRNTLCVLVRGIPGYSSATGTKGPTRNVQYPRTEAEAGPSGGVDHAPLRPVLSSTYRSLLSGHR